MLLRRSSLKAMLHLRLSDDSIDFQSLCHTLSIRIMHAYINRILNFSNKQLAIVVFCLVTFLKQNIKIFLLGVYRLCCIIKFSKAIKNITQQFNNHFVIVGLTVCSLNFDAILGNIESACPHHYMTWLFRGLLLIQETCL